MRRFRDLSFLLNEEGEDPNAQPQEGQEDPNAQPQEGQEDPNQDPNAQQGMEGQEDPSELVMKSNFINYNKLLYYNKFEKLLTLIEMAKNTFNKNKSLVNYDDVEDLTQYKKIEFFIKELDVLRDQIIIINRKALPNIELDKVRVIFKSCVNKINILINSYEELFKGLKLDERKLKEKQIQ